MGVLEEEGGGGGGGGATCLYLVAKQAVEQVYRLV